jgi:hypothetical protein
MYSMAQHAVANGYGKIEYLRAHAIARSSRVTTIASPRSALSSDVARRGAEGGGNGFGTTFVLPSASRPVKRPFAFAESAG